MKFICSLLFSLLLFSTVTYSQDADLTAAFNKLILLKEEVKTIHPALENLYPIAIYKDTTLTIYEPNERGMYALVKKVKSSRPLHPKIMAAFPLGENENKMTCVVHGGIFDSEEGYVFIFHEFWHCFQYNTVEFRLKKELTIYQNALKSKDYMWEINHQFPYDDPLFEEYYTEFMNAAMKKNLKEVKNYRTKLKNILSEEDYEYMTWQEWKEGSARWIENSIRTKFEIEVNNYGNEKPFNRVAFYVGGALIIDMLSKQNDSVMADLKLLYNSMVEL